MSVSDAKKTFDERGGNGGGNGVGGGAIIIELDDAVDDKALVNVANSTEEHTDDSETECEDSEMAGPPSPHATNHHRMDDGEPVGGGGGRKDPFLNGQRRTQSEHCPSSPSNDSQVNLFTCFIGPCPEVINANFKHPEFMICYRDANSRCDNSMMRYYCCPLYLAKINKNGEETYELRSIPTESNLTGDEYRAQQEREWRKYYGMTPPSLGAHFDFRQLPHHFNYVHSTCFTCPPPMMTYAYANYRCHAHPHSQHAFQPFGYQNFA